MDWRDTSKVKCNADLCGILCNIVAGKLTKLTTRNLIILTVNIINILTTALHGQDESNHFKIVV